MISEGEMLIDAFEDMLDQERALLMSGSVEGLERLAEQKSALVRRLSAVTGADELQRLKWKAEQNSRLFEAAAAGIRSVSQRISALRVGPKPLTTYSADGQRTDLGASRGTLERRA